MSIKIVKTCLACRFFELDFGTEDWSEDPFMRCVRGHFYESDTRTLELNHTRLAARAKSCQEFEVNPELE